MIENKVKLVVWDLDDTFWRGTLSEEGITPVDRNIEIVTALPKRGILNSICSKNDPDQTKAKLVELGVWDWFVFPSISFNPKGKAVAEMIERAALRAENVLFIDDSISNLEEVRFFNPGIMTAHPDEVLEGLLDHPNLAGKPDPELNRLKQYKFLQQKTEERSASDLSNEEFLRACNIRVTIDYEIERNFDRIVDLINRANQLNYTKLRLNTPAGIRKFRAGLGAFGRYAGCVYAVDNYGDYGLIGFFLMRRRAQTKKLIHFVFSCRTMNMGIEQYVYDSLDRPDIEIVKPVSYGLQSHTAVDWINAGDEKRDGTAGGDSKLVLVGGCHLLQLASYCSANRDEFVNVCRGDDMVRFDDPGFITNDRAALQDVSEALGRLPCWQYEDALRFDVAAAGADLFLIAFWPAVNAKFLRVGGRATVCLKEKRWRTLEDQNSEWFRHNIEQLNLTHPEKIAHVAQAFDALGAMGKPESQIFVLSCYTKGELENGSIKRKVAFNDMCRYYCEDHPEKFRYVDLDAVIPADSLIAKEHFSRAGYFALAQHIMTAGRAMDEPLKAAS